MSALSVADTVRRSLSALAESVHDADTRAAVLAIRSGLDEPLRIAVAGRVKAGKSTLVNALLRQRVAPTDVGECTRFVTCYRFGVPERLEVVRVDGTRTARPLEPDGSLPLTIGEDPDQVARLDVWLSMDSLRDVTIVDTPGLMSATTAASAAAAQLLQLDRASRAAVSDAEVLLLVMPLDPRSDDLAVLERFDEQFRGLTRHAMNAVGVLSRIDEVGVSADEVALRAKALSHTLAETHRLSLAAVNPVNGLLAESAGCGLITEDDASVVSAVAALPERERKLLLLSADRFASSECEVPAAERRRLLELLDLHGVELAVSLALSGRRGAAELTRQLLAQSGIDALRRGVFEGFARRAAVHKAVWAVSALSLVVTNDPADGARLLDAAERLALDPDLHVVSLLRALQQIAAGEVELEAALLDDLTRLAVLSGLDPDAPEDMSALERSELVASIRLWRAVAGDGRAGPRVQEVADAVVRSYESLL